MNSMRTTSRSIALATIGLVTVIALPDFAFAAPASVEVRNTAANPVPVTVVNPSNAVIVNPGTAPIPVTGTVNIGTMPPVSVTSNVTDPAKNAYTASAETTTLVNSVDLNFSIPASNRLVIENASIDCQTPTGSAPPSLAFLRYFNKSTPSAISGATSYILLQLQSTNNAGYDYYVGNMTGRVYVDAGLQPLADMAIVVIPSTTVACQASIGGYLVPMP